MTKIRRFIFGFFLAALWPSACMLGAQAPSSDAVSSATEETTPEIDSAVQMAQQEVRDPFAIAKAPEAPASAPAVSQSIASEGKMVLQGIGFGSKDAYAVIGGDVFYEGDEKQGIKLVEVRKREVDILVSGRKITVPLFPDQDLQKAKDRAKQKNAMKHVAVGQNQEAD